MAAAQGAQAKLGMSASGSASEAYEFKSESISLVDSIYESDGIVGSRDYPSERIRQNITSVEGSITMEPNKVELINLMPRILGGAGPALAETLPTSNIVIDRIQKVFTYAGCVVNKATFRASQGGPLSLEYGIQGVSESIGNAGTFPVLSISVASGPFIMSDLAVTIASTSYKFFDIEISIDNMLEMRHLNSLTPTSITPRSRQTSVTLTSPYGDNSALYAANVPGAAVVATFTNGSDVLVFTMPAVAFLRKTPSVTGKTEIKNTLQGIARKSGSTASLAVSIT